MKKLSVFLLSLSFLTIFCSSILRAQDFTYPYSGQGCTSCNPEYMATAQYQIPDGAQFSNTDPFVNLSMECLAANGYGQWTCSSNVGNFNFANHTPKWYINPDVNYNPSVGWFLLGNVLNEPSERLAYLNPPANTQVDPTHPGCKPPGIVSGGNFSGTNGAFPANNPKATANLLGSVRYVWIDNSLINQLQNNQFIIQGLSDDQQTPNGSTPQINIALDGIPNPMITTQIVKSAISQLVNAAATGNHPVTTAGLWQDRFDIACDAKFLYIVWTFHNMQTGKDEVWATAVDIVTGAVANNNFPIQVSPLPNVQIGDFNRPTVACDVRANTSGTITPRFAVAYINATVGTVSVAAFNNNTATTEAFENFNNNNNFKQYWDPWHPANNIGYATATHARVVVSSVAGSNNPFIRVYVNTNEGLILYSPTFPANNVGPDIANYVDGRKLNHGTPTTAPLPLPLDGSAQHRTIDINTGGVVDEPIIAFANPYDNQDLTHGYNQFHCMYRLSVTNDGNLPARNPLIIIRGSDNGISGGNYSLANDTRLLLNQDNNGVQNDPTSYIGAVNQMGIHMHWRSGTTHFYARNFRKFDEDIEENTLVTNQCVITDGSSHGGTVGATLLKGKKMTVWTDPNYGATTSDVNSGLYWKTNSLDSYIGYGKILFYAGGLTIGESGDNPAILYTMPVCDLSTDGSNVVGITINPNSSWECYQSTYIYLLGVPVTLQGYLSNGNKIIANLNIHGGALFSLDAQIVSNIGAINILFEPNIYPQNLSALTSSTNTSATGFLNIVLPATLTDSYVTSNIHSGSSDVMDFQQLAYVDPQTFTSTNTDYTNHGGGIGKINFAPFYYPYNGAPAGGRSQDVITFSSGTVSSMRLHFTDPKLAPIYIGDITFQNTSEKEIFIERTQTYSLSNDYGPITITGCHFDDSYNLNGGHDPSTQYGIYVKNFNNSNDYANLNITDNLFTYGSNTYCSMNAAIALENSTGNVMSNTISDNGYSKGVYIHSTPIGNNLAALTYAYLCSNSVSNVRQGFPNLPSTYGIYSDHYLGNVNYNQLSGMSNGYVSGINDFPTLFSTSILNCGQAGIQTTDMSTIIDLSGIHGASLGSSDLAPYNTVKGNCQDLATGQILLADQSVIYLGKRFGWWNHWGENNIESTAASLSALVFAVSSGNGTYIGNIDNNFFGLNSMNHKIDPSHNTIYWDVDDNTRVFVQNTNGTPLVTYDVPTTILPSETTATNPGCQGYSPNIIQKGNDPLSIPPTPDSCKALAAWVGFKPSLSNKAEFKLQYDTLTHYIESCALLDSSFSFHAFSSMDADVQNYASIDSNIYDYFRDWLLTVLYLNPNPNYYCACMTSIAFSYSGGKYHNVPNALLSVLKYMLDNNACNHSYIQSLYDQDKQSNHDAWLAGDTTKPEDTILPPLDSIGLGILLQHSGVSQTSPLSQIYLASFTSNPNPFKNETTLDFTLNRIAYIQLAIYDELGRLIWGDGRGSSLEAGDHSVRIDVSKWESGTYYARISTGFGEVKTVKLVHEK